jgi:hypothetical protein
VIIRAYGEFPRVYAPDIGEVLEIRLSGSNPWARAVVTRVIRRLHGVVRINFMWMETVAGCTAVAGEYSHVYYHPDGPPLVRHVSGGRRV